METSTRKKSTTANVIVLINDLSNVLTTASAKQTIH